MILSIENGEHGDLTQWAKQGVFLVNTKLSVVQGSPNSHSFWKPFTDFVIKYISDNAEDVIFVCWGSKRSQKNGFS